MPLYYGKILPSGPELLRTLAYELYSFDPFDVTGPVADDTHFYGRRDEARELVLPKCDILQLLKSSKLLRYETCKLIIS